MMPVCLAAPAMHPGRLPGTAGARLRQLGRWLLAVSSVAFAQQGSRPSPERTGSEGAAASTAFSPTEIRELPVQTVDGGFRFAADDVAANGALLPPVLLTASPAAYPPALRGTGAEGTVELELLVDDQGEVADVRVSRSARPELDAAALEAAHRLRFRPATADGIPLAARIHFTYAFHAEARPPASPALLRGVVQSKGNRRPIAGAVLVRDGEPVAETDADGRFEAPLSPGSTALEVSAPGYLPARFNETLAAGERLGVTYSLAPRVIDPYQTFVRGEKERTEVTRVTLHAQELTEVAGTMGEPFRVVMLMPGVGAGMSGISYPVVRGAQPAATGYFVDGVDVPELFHLLLGPEVVAPELLDTIEFYPGPTPVRYGRLMGGAVDASVRRPREDRLHVSAYADLLNAGALVEDWFPHTGTSVTLAGRYSYTPFIASRVAGALTPPGADGSRIDPIANFWDYQGRVEQRLGAGRLRLFVFGASDEAGWASSSPQATDPRLISTFHRADLRYRVPVGPGELETSLTYGTQDLGVRALQNGGVTGAFELVEQESVARASWSGELAPTLAFSIGGDLTARRSHNLIRGALSGASADQGSLATFSQPLVLTTFAGAWAEAVWKPTRSWTVVTGMRADGYHLTPGIEFFAADPRLTARWQVRPELVLKAGAAMVHQPPSVLINLPVLQADALRYGLQSGAQSELGAEWSPLPGFELSVDGYYNPSFRTVELNLLQVVEDQRRFSLPAYDPGLPGRAYGVEVLLRHPIGNHWFGWLSYAYQRAERYQTFSRIDAHGQLTGVTSGWVPFAFEQQHVANAALSYRFDSGWTVGGVVHFNTGRPQTGDLGSRSSHPGTAPDGTSIWVVDDRDRVQRLPPLVRVDARVSRTWVFDQLVLEASLDLQNATVSQEVLSYSYAYEQPEPAPGQPYDPSVPAQLVKLPVQLPLVIPMLGVKVTY